MVALRTGLHEMVLASLGGAILANLLLAMGISFLVGGIRHHTQEYNQTSIRVYSSMMLIAVMSLLIPSAFHRVFGAVEFTHNENELNVAIAIILLTAYVLYLVFLLRTHKEFFKSKGGGHEPHGERWSLPKALGLLLGASAGAAFMSELLVGAAEETGRVMGLSSVFIGIVFLSIVGGAVESISAISMASKNKMDLSISILLGSSIQIALFISPLLVLCSLFVGPEQLNLSFGSGMIALLFLSVLIGELICGDGQSNWYKGVQLIVVYLILAMMLYFVPEAA